MNIFHYPHSPTNTLQRDEFWERVCVPGVPGHAARLDGAGRRQEARGESRRHRRLQQHARLPQHLREITVIYYILCFIDTRKTDKCSTYAIANNSKYHLPTLYIRKTKLSTAAKNHSIIPVFSPPSHIECCQWCLNNPPTISHYPSSVLVIEMSERLHQGRKIWILLRWQCVGFDTLAHGQSVQMNV